MATDEVGRRAVLVGAGCAALALLGACTSYDDGSPAAGPSPVDSGLLAKTGDVPVGGGIVAPGDVLVLQLTAGNFTAFRAICPHQEFRLRPPDAGGTITCLGHLSHFRAADGSRIDGPATRGLFPVEVKLDGDRIMRA